MNRRQFEQLIEDRLAKYAEKVMLLDSGKARVVSYQRKSYTCTIHFPRTTIHRVVMKGKRH